MADFKPAETSGLFFFGAIGAIWRRLAGLIIFPAGAERESFGVDELDVVDADEAEEPPQEGALQVGVGAGVASAARGEHEGALAREQADRALGRIAERDPGPRDMVEVGLERRGHAEVVHRHAEHQYVGPAQFVDERVRLCDVTLLLHRSRGRRRRERSEALGGQVRQGLARQVADLHGGAGGGCQGAGELARQPGGLARFAGQAGVQLQDLGHGGSPRREGISWRAACVAKAAVDKEVTSLKAEVAKLSDTNKTLANELEASKTVLSTKDERVVALEKQLEETKAELQKAIEEINNAKIAATKAARRAKLVERGCAEDRADALVEKFVNASDEMFSELVNAFPPADAAKKEMPEDMKKEKKEDKAKCSEDATAEEKVLEEAAKAAEEEVTMNTSTEDAAKAIRSKASSWLCEGVLRYSQKS